MLVFESSLPNRSLCSRSENTHEVVLKKSLSGLGFSFNISQLRSGPDRGSVVRIKRLFPGQPALESGLLREGDIILSVNKEPVKDLSYQVAGHQKFILHTFLPLFLSIFLITIDLPPDIVFVNHFLLERVIRSFDY